MLEEAVFEETFKENLTGVFGGFLQRAREDCQERGYHLVASEREEGTMSCYMCGLLFDRAFAEARGIKYAADIEVQ